MNPLFRIPLKWQLIIIVAIVAFPAVGIIIYSGVQQRYHAINDARTDTQRLVDRISSEQNILEASALQLVVAVSQLPEVQVKNAAKVNQLLRDRLNKHPSLAILFIADRTGYIWASAEPISKPIAVYDRRYFENALKSGHLSSGEFQVSRISQKPSLIMGYPYKNNNSEIIGVVGVGISLDYYQNLLKRTHFPNRADITILDHKGIILFSERDTENRIGKQSNSALFKRMKEGPNEDTLVALGVAGDSPRQKRYISYQKLSLEGERTPYMYVRVGIPYKSTLSYANEQILRNMSIFTLVFMVALFLAWLVGKRSIVDRINVLEMATRNLANDGPCVIVSDLIKGGELGRLEESFDVMAQRLRLKANALAEQQLQLKELNISLEQRVADSVMDLRKKDQILIQQGRQAAMGEMIGNIAHQWRQPLNTLGLIVQEIKMTYGHAEFNKEILEANVTKAMNLIQHMSKTIDDFSNYFKPGKEKKLFNVNQAVTRTLTLVEQSIKNLNINVEVIVADDTGIDGYENEYSQVLLNILLNCRDAFEACNLDSQCMITITIDKENDKSVVTIADNAGGIAEDVIDKIFDPYFTTKGPGKGTGIGLYMAKTIIEKNMEGRLTVRNTADGAEFRIEV